MPLSYNLTEIPNGADVTQLITTPRDFQDMMMRYQCAVMEVETKIRVLNEEFALRTQRNPIESIKSRLKSPASIYEKMERRGFPVTVESMEKNLNDIAGVRVICSFPEDIYNVARLITEQDDIVVLEIKDYIANPKPNGYRSLHLIVAVPIFLASEKKNMKVELQFRTIAMDFWASLEHKMYYKFEGNAPENIRRELKECADLVGFLDRKMMAINEEIRKYSPEEEEGVLISDSLRRLYGMVNEENESKEAILHNEKEAVVIDLDEAQLRHADGEQVSPAVKKKIFSMPKNRKATMK